MALARTIVDRAQGAAARRAAVEPRRQLRVQVRRELRELQRRLGITTIFVTHDQEEANYDLRPHRGHGRRRRSSRSARRWSSIETPANLFVAAFLGTANILAGRVLETGAGRVFEIEGGTISATAHRQRRADKWQTCFPSAKRTA